jgi:hypothetical protein
LIQNTAVSGIYHLKEQAERALDTIIAGGIRGSSISVVLLDSSGVGAHGSVGAHGGGNCAIGGSIGVLGGAGAVAISGVQLIGAGPVMAGLTMARLGASESGAHMNGLVRALMGIGMSGRDAERCAVQVGNGGTLLSLSCNSAEQVLRARELLTATGATGASGEGGDSRVA